MTSQTNNVEYLVVGSSNTTAIASIYTMNDLADGDIRLFTTSGKPIGDNAAGGASSDATANMKFVIAVGGASSKPQFVSEVIDGSKIEVIRSRAYTAATEQLDYIGYNGSSGSIEAIDDNEYYCAVYMEEYLRSSHDGRYNKHFSYISDATAIQSEIAIGLAGSGVANFSKEVKNSSGNPPVRFKAICNEAVSATNDSSGIMTVVKGSKSVKIVESSGGAGDAGNYNGTTSDMAVGDYLRIHDTDTTATLTDDVYEIMAIDGTVGGAGPVTLTLDRPYQGTGGTRTDGNNSTQVIPAATGDAANWGVALVGQPQDIVIGKEFYKKIRWTLSPKEFGSTTITYSTKATEGSGVPNQVISMEWFLKGFEGEHYRIGEPSIHTFSARATTGVTGGGYDVTRIVYKDDSTVGFHSEVSPKVITIVSPATAPAYMTDSTANGGVWNSLEVIAGTGKCTGVSAAGVATAGDLNV